MLILDILIPKISNILGLNLLGIVTDLNIFFLPIKALVPIDTTELGIE